LLIHLTDFHVYSSPLIVGLPIRHYPVHLLFINLALMQRWTIFLSRRLEVSFWILALAGLYFMPGGEGHFTLCPIGALGFTWCPGCGLGHALHDMLHGNFVEAFRHHYLVLFAFFIILYRIFQLTILNHKFKLIHVRRQDL
jgi:hypothetical protein